VKINYFILEKARKERKKMKRQNILEKVKLMIKKRFCTFTA